MTTPTRGLCHSVFLLTYSAQSKRRVSVSDWVAGARNTPTFMANALAIDSAAKMLQDYGLAVIDEDGVHIDAKLLKAGDEASTETLATIAAVLLRVQPPPWFKFAVRGGVVSPELIPTRDEDALCWLEDLRDPILLDVATKNHDEDGFRDWLGSLGEQLILASEKHIGRSVVHASKISDFFGYDIKSRSGEVTWHIEVKTALTTNSDHFYISKNEARRAQELAETWWLVQVIFDPASAAVNKVEKGHFLSVRSISAKHLVNLLPEDTNTGKWIENAHIRPTDEVWSGWEIKIPPSWSHPGFRSDDK